MMIWHLSGVVPDTMAVKIQNGVNATKFYYQILKRILKSRYIRNSTKQFKPSLTFNMQNRHV